MSRPGGKSEEDGVLLSILIYSDQKRPIQVISFFVAFLLMAYFQLLFLDPKDLTELARANTGITSQPYAFHHTYFPIDFSAKKPAPPVGQLAIN